MKRSIRFFGEWDDYGTDCYGSKIKASRQTIFLSRYYENKLKFLGMRHGSRLLITIEVKPRRPTKNVRSKRIS